jgi:hypothetical protein
MDKTTGRVGSSDTRSIFPHSAETSAIEMARDIYRIFCQANPHNPRQPIGVVFHRQARRVKLLFKEPPILLPDEYFIGIEYLSMDLPIVSNWTNMAS